MGNLEFRMTSLSKTYLDNLCALAHFRNLNKKESKPFLKIVSSQPHFLRFPFIHTYTGEEIVEVSLQYFDSKGNPSIYDVEFEVGILSKEEKGEGHRSINISFTAEKIMGCDFEHMAEIYGERKEEKQKNPHFMMSPRKGGRGFRLILMRGPPRDCEKKLQLIKK